jgi:hypothetical protein
MGVIAGHSRRETVRIPGKSDEFSRSSAVPRERMDAVEDAMYRLSGDSADAGGRSGGYSVGHKARSLEMGAPMCVT